MAKKRFRPAKGKIIAIGAVLAVVVFFVAIRLVSNSSNQLPAVADTRAGSPGDISTAGATGTPTEEYRSKVDEMNAQKADAAEKSGQSYVPTPIGTKPSSPPMLEINPSGEEEKKTSKPAMNTSVSSPKRPKFRAAQAPTSTRSTGRSRDRDSEEQIRLALNQFAWVDEMTKSTPQVVKVYDVPDREESEDAGDGVASQAGNHAETADDEEAQTPIKSGDVLYAVNEVTLNSDAPGPVLATILSGELKGSRAVGSFQRSDEYLVVRFEKFVTPDGEEISVDAVAVDPDMAGQGAGVRSDVDTHFFQRWGSLAAASFIGRLGDAVSRSGSTTTTYSSGYSVSSNPEFSTRDELLIAGGAVGERAAGIIEKNFDRPPTVTLDAGQPMGIMIVNAD